MFIGELKQTLFSYNINEYSFVNVNLLCNGKGADKSVRISNYSSTKYNDTAYRVGASPSVYIELESIQFNGERYVNNSLVFSQMELKNFCRWFKNNYSNFYNLSSLTYNTENKNYYPDIGFSFKNTNEISIWKVTNVETINITSVPLNVIFTIFVDIFEQAKNNFLVLSSNIISNFLNVYFNVENAILMNSMNISKSLTSNTNQQIENKDNIPVQSGSGWDNPNVVPNNQESIKKVVNEPITNINSIDDLLSVDLSAVFNSSKLDAMNADDPDDMLAF